jgi:hypothetical protein
MGSAHPLSHDEEMSRYTNEKGPTPMLPTSPVFETPKTMTVMCFRQRRVPQVVPSAGGLARYRGEPVLGVVELPGDHVLDVLAERGVWAQDDLAQHWDQRVILPGQGVSFGPVVWSRPTTLSVKSETLTTHAQGLACRLAMTCWRYCYRRRTSSRRMAGGSAA